MRRRALRRRHRRRRRRRGPRAAPSLSLARENRTSANVRRLETRLSEVRNGGSEISPSYAGPNDFGRYPVPVGGNALLGVPQTRRLLLVRRLGLRRGWLLGLR